MDRLLIDVYSFGAKGLKVVSEEFISTCEQFIDQLRVKSAIDNITFKSEVIGEEFTVYIRRYNDDFLVSLEAKDFTVED